MTTLLRMPAPVTADAVLIGVGDLGTRIGLGLAEQGLQVAGLRRSAHLVSAPIRPVPADLLGPEPLPSLSADLLVVCLTADGRDESAYRRTYLEGMCRALDALTRPPRRAVLVSSTSVYGDREGLLDEDSPPEPTSATGAVLLEAESAFRERLPQGTGLRMSGIYGPTRARRLVDQVLRGENTDPGRWTNRIHEDDAAAAVVHVLTRLAPDAEPASHYLVTDDEPVPVGEVRDFLAQRLADRLTTPWTSQPVEPHGKRLSNARLRRTGFRLRYPSYREGYGSFLPLPRD